MYGRGQCRRSAVACIAALVFPLFLQAPGEGGEGVFEEPNRDYAVEGKVATSDGKSFSGTLYTTLGKPLKIYDRVGKKHVSFTLKDISRIDVSVEEEHDEPVWRWKESGGDEKVFTGETYPWRKYLTTVTLAGGKKIAGDLSGLVYLETPDGAKHRFLLHKRQKGKEGEKLADLIFLVSIALETGQALGN